MAVFNNTIITKKGQALIAKILAGTVVDFTKIRTSNHEYPANTDFENLTVMGSIKQEIVPSQIIVENVSTVRIKAVIANTSLTTGYSLKNIGLYALDPNEGEILFSITTSSVSDFIPSYNGTNISYINIDLLTSVSNSQNVNLTVSAGGLVTRDMLDVELGKYVLKTLQATETLAGLTKYGTLSGTALEGHQMSRILGIADDYYGGLISAVGTKTIGKAYYDTNTMQIYLCKETNNLNYVDLNKFTAFSNKSLLDKLENLYGITSFTENVPGYGSGRKKMIKVGNQVTFSIYFETLSTGFTINEGSKIFSFPVGWEPITEFIFLEFPLVDVNSTNENVARLVISNDGIYVYGVGNKTHFQLKGTGYYFIKKAA